MAEVHVRDFRGVKGKLHINLVGRSGTPVSAIVFGENGTGKSSIVDAVEWACQGKVGRSVKFDARSRPLLFNAAGDSGSCLVEVLLNDGTTLTRRAKLDEDDHNWITSSGDSRDFQYVPMSLKRADILTFLETSPERRGMLLMDHYLGSGEVFAAPIERERDADDVVAAAKTRVRQSAVIVADVLGIEPPHELGAIRSMLNDYVYKGVAERYRKAVTLPKHLEAVAPDLVRALVELDEAKRRLQTASAVKTPAVERVQRTHAILGDVGDWMSVAFRQITGATHVKRISAEIGRLGPMSLELDVELTTGFTGTPQRVFSEGYQDLVAMLYFLAVARAAGEHGQAKVLILDDVLQSVDAGIRVRLMRLVLDQFPDWQLLVTVHDRLWRTQLQALFQSAGHSLVEIEIRDWSFGGGPSLAYGMGDRLASGDLENALNLRDPATVCAVAGRLLEHLCDRLSFTLPSSVKRRQGDRYTLHDLWPGVHKLLSKTALAESARDVETWVHLRNAAGAHYNEWAESLSWADAENFGFAVLALADQVQCPKCGQWVERQGSSYVCKCGATCF